MKVVTFSVFALSTEYTILGSRRLLVQQMLMPEVPNLESSGS